MKKNDLLAIRKMTLPALHQKLAELEKELVQTRLKFKRGDLTNVRACKNIRYQIAVIKTIMREKELLKQLKVQESK